MEQMKLNRLLHVLITVKILKGKLTSVVRRTIAAEVSIFIHTYPSMLTRSIDTRINVMITIRSIEIGWTWTLTPPVLGSEGKTCSAIPAGISKACRIVFRKR